MSSIDERVVQMQFDNAQFERGAHETISTLDKLKQSLNFGGAEQSIQGVESSMNNINLNGFTGAVYKAAQSFSVIQQIAASTINRITNDLITYGTRFVKSLSIDNIWTGFSKYEMETKAVQTILANTNATLDQTNDLIAKLMWYTDETSYSFDGMISNISKFTTAGVGLADAQEAMIGIANACGLAGVEAGKAVHAMDGFSKAMGRGYMDSQSWTWIHTAGLDGKVFNEQLVQAGLNTGTLVRETRRVDGQMKEVILTNKKFGTQLEVSAENIQNTLVKRWLDMPTMLEALGAFAGFTNEVYEASQLDENSNKTVAELIDLLGSSDEEMRSLGERALRASQETRTFSDAINSVKEAVSSQWTETMNLVFGDYEEAKELWGDLNEYLWDLFTASGEKRNEALRFWKDNGGREAILKGLYNAAEQFKNIIDTISEAWGEVFDIDLGSKLTEWSIKIGDFLSGLDFSGEKADKLKSVVKGLATIFKKLLSTIQSIYEFLSPVFSFIKSGLSKFWDFLSNFGKFISGDVDTEGALKISKIFDIIKTTVTNIKESLFGGKSLDEGFKGVGNAVKGFFDMIKTAFENFPSFDIIKGGSMAAMFGSLIYLLWQLNWLIDTLSTKGLVGALLGDFDSIWSPIGQIFKSMKAVNITRTILNVAAAFAAVTLGLSIMANAFARIGEMDPGQIITAFISLFAILGMIGAYLAIMKQFSKGSVRTAFATILVATAIAIIAKSFIALGGAGDTIGSGLIALGGILGIMALFLLIGSIAKKAMRNAFATIFIATAIAIITNAFIALGNSGDAIEPGLIALGGILGIMVLFLLIGSIAKKAMRNAFAAMLLSTAIVIITRSFITLGTAGDAINSGLIALGGILGIMVLFLLIGSIAKKAMRTAFSTLFIAVAIVIITNSFITLGRAGDAVGSGLVALGGILSIIVLFLLIGSIAEKAVATAFSTLLIATAIVIIANAFITLGSSGDAIWSGLGALGGILSIIVMFLLIGSLAQKAVGSAVAVLLIAVAMDLLVVAFAGFAALGDSLQNSVMAMIAILAIVALLGQTGGAGMMSFAVSVLILSAALVVAAIAVAVFSLAINILARQDFDSIISAAIGLSVALIALAAVAALIGLFAAPVIAGAMAIAALALAVILCAGAMWLLSEAIEHSGPLVEALGKLFNKLGDAIERASGLAGNSFMGYEFDTDEYGNTIARKIETSAEEIDSAATELDEANEHAADALGYSGVIEAARSKPAVEKGEGTASITGDTESIISSFTSSILAGQGKITGSASILGASFIDTLSGLSGNAEGIGNDFITSFTTGLGDPAGLLEVNNKATKVESDAVDSLSKGNGEAKTAGGNLALGYAKGIESESGAAAEAAKAMVEAAIAAINAAQDSGSPSKITFQSGRWFDEGYSNAIRQYAGVSREAAYVMGQDTVTALGEGLKAMDSIANGSVTVTPSVRPVMDISSIQNGSRSIDTMFATRQAMYANIADAERRNGSDMTILVGVANAILTAVNSGHDLYIDDHKLIGRINRGLGRL